jgi:hypothetical protein
MQNSHTKIQILTYFNPHHKILYDMFFKPTYDLFLSDSFELIIKYEESSVSNNISDYGYQKKIWQQMVVDRFDFIINHIKSNINNKIISIFSDVDIVFLGDFYDKLSRFINNPLLMLWYMPESIYADAHYVNGGFFAFKHSLENIKYFEYIKYQLLSNDTIIKNDQPLIQKYLKSVNASYVNVMPYQVFNTNNCDININLALINQNILKVFHATSTSSVFDKIIILDKVIDSIKNKLLSIQKIDIKSL